MQNVGFLMKRLISLLFQDMERVAMGDESDQTSSESDEDKPSTSRRKRTRPRVEIEYEHELDQPFASKIKATS